MRSPIVWFGGKGNLIAKILPWFPSHHTYVEPFGGGASLLFAKSLSPLEVYNDLNEGLTSFLKYSEISSNLKNYTKNYNLRLIQKWNGVVVRKRGLKIT
jgi:DNA adenine methylase